MFGGATGATETLQRIGGRLRTPFFGELFTNPVTRSPQVIREAANEPSVTPFVEDERLT